ncbi:hypothetical protein NE237_028248 [Protea cynaroides]|uniref:Uncharacterized protein n=1 Tax=Protea cynaroides TaxID=273540 RepID=A0A9Q0GQU0_9MAGN|nr:hypothetical protein NE237_028248 [Protea cynaroides]
MDFQSLTRRELQALCKKYKIPANMTNVAMVDALKALDHVEGLSVNPESIPDTPKRPDILSPDHPRTSRRTSIRQKPVAETETKENTNVSDISETPVTRNGKRRVAGTLVRQKTETHKKECNKGGEQEGQKEDPTVPVLSLRRSARFSKTQVSESVQKKGSVRVDAIKIGVLSEEEHKNLEEEESIVGSEISVIDENKVTEEEHEDLKEEASIVGSEISVIEENKVTEPVVSGEIFIHNNNTESNTDESSVLDSSDAKPQDGEEADGSFTDDVVSVTQPVSTEVHGTGSLASEEEELHGASLYSESMSPEEIFNSDNKEVVVDSLLPKESNPSTNNESIVGDLIGNEKQGKDNCRVDEDPELEETFSLPLEKTRETQSLEIITEKPEMVEEKPEVVEEKGSDDGLTESGEFFDELEETFSLPLEKTSETQSLETKTTEKPEVVEEKGSNDDGLTESGEVSNELEETFSLPLEKTSEMQSLETTTEKPEVEDESLELKNNTDQLAGEESVFLQLKFVDSVTDQVQKYDPVLEMGSSSIDESEEGDCVAAVQGAVADDAIDASETLDQFAMAITKMNAESDMAEDIVDSSSFNVQSPILFSSVAAAHVTEADATATAATDVIYEVPMPNDYMENNKSSGGDGISSGLHLQDEISLPLSTFNPITTPTPRKSGKKNQTPGKSSSKRTAPIQIMVFDDNKENNQNGIGFAHASPITAGVEVEKKKVVIPQKDYKDMSKRQLIKIIKEKAQQLQSRTALQTLNKN